VIGGKEKIKIKQIIKKRKRKLAEKVGKEKK
jgi:hypothetical protein